MFSPKVEQSIAAKFQSGQKDEVGLRLKMEMLAEIQFSSGASFLGIEPVLGIK